MKPAFSQLKQFSRASSGLRDAVLTMLYPMSCRVCGTVVESWRDGVACDRCWLDAELKLIPAQCDLCAKCGLPLPLLPTYIATDERRCGRCDHLSFTRARACGVYEGAIRESVLWLKHRPQIAPRLRELLRMALADLDRKQEIESILPVPLHPNRFAERTFNQSEIIARELAAISGLRVDSASLVRVRHTEKHRAGMAARERVSSM
ncbi:MAG: hypothetical protein ABI977_20945, partial [Acidobacteriota bacterium]